MADRTLDELGTFENFDNIYVELSQKQYRISKENLGKQVTDEVHMNFSVTSSDPAYIFAQKSDGTNFRISKADLTKDIKLNDESGLGGEHPRNRALYNGCYIMYHDSSYETAKAVPYADWPSLQDSGEEADGVLIVEGSHSLVVAPHEKKCKWSSKPKKAAETVKYSSSNRILLLNTWDGKERTAKICTDPSSPFYAESANDTYAPGYCYNYTPHVTGKAGLTAGKYWLPCVAELMMIYTHKYRINAGLALIDGANQLSDAYYWASTETNTTSAWCIDFDDGDINGLGYKSISKDLARPVSAFISDAY